MYIIELIIVLSNGIYEAHHDKEGTDKNEKLKPVFTRYESVIASGQCSLYQKI